MGKILVAFFSPSGVTATTAYALAHIMNADAHEIKPVEPYTLDDMNWQNYRSRSSHEMGNPACRPEFIDDLHGIEEYSTIFIGFPIWWYVAPRIIDTFLERYDFTGKTIVPFATSGGTGMEKAEQRMKAICHGSANWKSGTILNHKSAAELEAWIEGLEIDY